MKPYLNKTKNRFDSQMAVKVVSNKGWMRCVIAFVSCFMLIKSTLADDQKLNVVTEQWAPYNYSENGSLKGLSVEIVRAIAKKLNVSIDIQLVPSMRAKFMLENNPRTMLITMLRTAERETKYKWVGPLDDSSIYFYKNKTNPIVISTLEDAKKVRSICSRQAGLVFSKLKAAGFTNLETTTSEAQLIYKKLLHNRCDLAISDSPLGVIYLLKQMNYPPDAITQTAVKLVESPTYFAYSKDIPDTEIARWQKALDRLKASGAFKAILRKYNE